MIMNLNIGKIIFLFLAILFIFATTISVDVCHHDSESVNGGGVHSDCGSSHRDQEEHCEKCIYHFPVKTFISQNDTGNFHKLLTPLYNKFNSFSAKILKEDSSRYSSLKSNRVIGFLTLISSIILNL